MVSVHGVGPNQYRTVAGRIRTVHYAHVVYCVAATGTLCSQRTPAGLPARARTHTYARMRSSHAAKRGTRS